jgi:hypothetical protein
METAWGELTEQRSSGSKTYKSENKDLHIGDDWSNFGLEDEWRVAWRRLKSIPSRAGRGETCMWRERAY